VWDALLRHEVGSSTFSRTLFFLRGYGARVGGAPRGSLPESIERFGFVRVSETPGEELVFGIAGRFWRWDGDLRRLAGAQAFLDFAEDGCVKGAWNIRVEGVAEGRTRLSTETRVQAFGPSARRKFRIYWSVIAPFSGLIRRGLLRGVARRAET
jgi:hypothetical protein